MSDGASQAEFAESASDEQHRIRIEDGALVLPSGCTMPLKCIKTNAPVTDRDMIFTIIGWAPPRLGWWALLGWFPLLSAYAFESERCEITYGLTPRLYYKNVLMTILKLLICAGLLVATVYVAILESTNRWLEHLVAVLFISFLISVVVVFIGNPPLRVVKYHDGMFWIKGFSQVFLDDLEL